MTSFSSWNKSSTIYWTGMHWLIKNHLLHVDRDLNTHGKENKTCARLLWKKKKKKMGGSVEAITRLERGWKYLQSPNSCAVQERRSLHILCTESVTHEIPQFIITFSSWAKQHPEYQELCTRIHWTVIYKYRCFSLLMLLMFSLHEAEPERVSILPRWWWFIACVVK